MIQVSELRIGNKIFTQSGKIATVEGIKRGDASHDFEYIVMFQELGIGNCYVRYCKPIPLTTEILEKFGFEQQNGVMGWEKEGVVIAYETLAGHFRLYPRHTKVESLHQLQNLYSLLTGGELNEIIGNV